MVDIKKKALQYLKKQRFAVISSVSPDGEPQAAVMSYLIDDDFNFYFITTNGSKKTENIKKNHKVAIAIGFGPEPITIQAGGKAELINNVSLELFITMFKYVPYREISQWPITKIAKDGFSTIKVKPEWISWLNLIENKDQDVSEEFIKVL